MKQPAKSEIKPKTKSLILEAVHETERHETL